MKIQVDENIPGITVAELRRIGPHDVADVRGTSHAGSADADIWQLAQREQRMFIITDKGFTQYRDEAHYGLLIVRVKQPNRQSIHNRVLHALRRFREDDWPGLTVVVRDRVQSVYRRRAT
jgi:predicted nuclease of predicted toxin-antitoxin system